MTRNHDTNRRRVLLGIGSATAVALAGCAGGDGTDTETETGMDGMDTDEDSPTETPTETPTDAPAAMVRVAHLSPNAPNVDVYVDGSETLSDVPFGAVSDYLSLPGGTYTVEITAAGDPDTSVFEGDVTVEGGAAYTVAAIGELGDEADQPFEPLILADDLSDPGEDAARVRAVHASPDAPAVDVTLASTGDALFDGVPYGASGAVEVPAGSYTLEIRPDTEGNDGDVVATFDVTVEAGGVYTAFAAGYLTPDDDPGDEAFDLIVAQDNGGM